MTDFFSKSSGPRREDVAAKRMIEQNRGTIERLADHLSNGAFSASKKPRAAPEARGLIIHDLGRSLPSDTPVPYVRISANDRVVLADHDTGKQLEFLGQIRRENGVRTFALATKANGFMTEVAPETAMSLASLDGIEMSREYGDDQLAADIRERLGIAPPQVDAAGTL